MSLGMRLGMGLGIRWVWDWAWNWVWDWVWDMLPAMRLGMRLRWENILCLRKSSREGPMGVVDDLSLSSSCNHGGVAPEWTLPSPTFRDCVCVMRMECSMKGESLKGQYLAGLHSFQQVRLNTERRHNLQVSSTVEIFATMWVAGAHSHQVCHYCPPPNRGTIV